MRAYFCVLEVAVSANRCSVIQGRRICNKMEEDGNSSYTPTPLNASIVAGIHIPLCVDICRWRDINVRRYILDNLSVISIASHMYDCSILVVCRHCVIYPSGRRLLSIHVISVGRMDRGVYIHWCSYRGNI